MTKLTNCFFCGDGLCRACAPLELRLRWIQAGRPLDLTEFVKNLEVRKLVDTMEDAKPSPKVTPRDAEK